MATSAATCTRTRPGRRTARTRSRRWRAEAKRRGYSYLAITDHSHYLRDGRLEAQDRRDRRRCNETLGRFRLLRGIEVNIRADGSIDVDDETLARLDWVVASLHTAFDKNPDRARDLRRWRTRTSTASAI